MPKFRVRYANIVVMEREVEAEAEVEIDLPFVDRDLERKIETLPHVVDVLDYDMIWEVEGLSP